MKKGNISKGVFYMPFIILCFWLGIRRVFLNVHIDEEIVIATAYRVVQGDSFFTQIQEPQLLIAPLGAAFEQIYFIVNGTTNGIFVFMKICTWICTMLVALGVYFVGKKHTTDKKAFFIAVIYYFYYFRYVNVADYTFLFVTASVLCVLLWVDYEFEKWKMLNIIFAGTCFCLMVICFPSVIILFPAFAYIYFRKSGRKGILVLVSTCFLWGILECLVIFRNHSIYEIPGLLQETVSSSTYMTDPYSRLCRIGIVMILMAIVIVIQKRDFFSLLVKKLKNKKNLLKGGYWISCGIFTYGIFRLFLSECCRLEYFNKYGNYYILAAGAIMIFLLQEKTIYRTIYLFGISADLCASIMTHYGTLFIYGFVAIAITTIMVLCGLETFNLRGCVCALLFVSFLFLEVFSKDILLIGNTGHSGDTIFNQRYTLLTDGPAKYALARETDAEKYNELLTWIHENVYEDTKLCYFGKNVLVYLMSPYITACVPQLFMDYSSDDVLGNYYKLHPEQMPDLVIEDISATTKRLVSEEEAKIFQDYTVVYESGNYRILRR